MRITPLGRLFGPFALTLSLSACTGVNPTGSVPSTANPPPSFRGVVTASSMVTTITTAQMQANQSFPIIYAVGGPPLCDVTLYSIDYKTPGVRGEQANASAALFVPGSGCGTGPFPLVGYAHGTNIVKEQKITDPTTTNPELTAPDQDPVVVAAIFAAQGYVVVATDYLGLGDSTYPYHPYLHVDSEASAVIDSLRAARTVAAKNGVSLSGQVLLTGHSQGGQVTMGTQRAIEALNSTEFNLVGSAPSSGPYDLTQTFQDSLANQSQDAPVLAAFILTGYNKIYNGNVYGTNPERRVPGTVFDRHRLVAARRDLRRRATDPRRCDLTAPAESAARAVVLFSFQNDPCSGARQDTAKNDFLQGWTARRRSSSAAARKTPKSSSRTRWPRNSTSTPSVRVWC